MSLKFKQQSWTEWTIAVAKTQISEVLRFFPVFRQCMCLFMLSFISWGQLPSQGLSSLPLGLGVGGQTGTYTYAYVPLHWPFLTSRVNWYQCFLTTNHTFGLKWNIKCLSLRCGSRLKPLDPTRFVTGPSLNEDNAQENRLCFVHRFPFSGQFLFYENRLSTGLITNVSYWHRHSFQI